MTDSQSAHTQAAEKAQTHWCGLCGRDHTTTEHYESEEAGDEG